MNTVNKALVAAAMLGALGLGGGSASAMPLSGPVAAAKALSNNTTEVRWVCGPYRCWWRPNYYYARPWWGGPRPFYGRPWWGGPRRYYARPWWGGPRPYRAWWGG